MKIEQVIKKAKREQASFKKLLNDLRYIKVMGFFCAKKLLLADVKPMPNVKIDVADVLWVADKIEPRVLEVLPAALIRFPKTFLRADNLPEQLIQIVRTIKAGEKTGPDFNGMSYQQMKRWADLPLADRRTKPANEKRQSRTYRFTQKTLENLKKISSKLNKTETAVIEDLIATL